MRAWKQTWKLIILSLLMMLAIPAVVLAAQSASTHYQVNEVFFGAGGSLNNCSTNYCSKQSIGETAVGDTASTNYQAHAGFNTDRQPYIQFQVNNTDINLGTLTANSTKTANTTFTVETYLAHGYTVVNASPPPSNGSYYMDNLTTPTASQAGVEQFGINLVANTLPISFGDNPTFQPGSGYSFGEVDSAYSNPNLYKYGEGDVIALSTKSSSQTTFTISYIFNISNVTPGGTYTFHHVLVATSTY
jgi:hypothetical protein